MTTIPPVAEADADDDLAPAYARIKQQYGQVLSFLGVMGHRPEVMKNWLNLFASITEQGSVAQEYKQLAFYFASKLNGCAYCCNMHRQFAKKAGVSDEKLDALPFFASSSLFSDQEKATLLFTQRVTLGAAGVRDEDVEPLRQFYDDGEIVELTLTVCLANFDNRWSNAMQLTPD